MGQRRQRGEELAKEVIRLIDESPGTFEYAYELDQTIKEKIEAISTKIYGADGVDFTPEAARDMANLEALGFGVLPICMAKTQYSLTDDPTVLGCPAALESLSGN